MKNYFLLIYKVLFETNDVFAEIKQSPSTSKAILTLVWINIFLLSIKYAFTGGVLNIFSYLFMLIFYLTSTLVSWAILGLFFEYIAKIYDKSGKLKTLLYLSSFSALPWIFIAPLELLKDFGDIGYFSGTLLELIIYFWTIFLYCKSLEYTYEIKFSRSIMLIFLPFLATFFAFFWLIGFFTKLGYIFTV